MGGSLRKKLHTRQQKSSAKCKKSNSHVCAGAYADNCSNGQIDENGNVSKKESLKESPKEKMKLPLADKRVTVEGSRNLLKIASSNAISELTTADKQPNLQELSSYNFPFENAVFEGGGVKGIAYMGAVKCLNDVGIKMTRFAGSSIGATVAGFLSVGYSADEMVALYVQDLSMFIRDSQCELLCFLPRLISNLGMNPGKAFLDWYGRCLAVKTQDADITFSQVYKRFGTELCVVVLNMNTGREEYFHPKTTPDLAIRVAVRMSISVPGVLEPISMRHSGGESDLYIDGGVICNYPIYVFDGWWLSMEPQNQIYRKLCNESKESISEKLLCLSDTKCKFGQRDLKTLGFKQTTNSNFFNDTFIHSSIGDDFEIVTKHSSYSRPATKLARKRIKRLMSLEKAAQVQTSQLGALLQLFKALRKCYSADGHILKDKLYEALTSRQDGFTDLHMLILFGKEVSTHHLMKDIPSNNNLITVHDFDHHLRRFGLDLHRMLESSATLRGGSLKGVKAFWSKLQRNILNAARRSYVKPEDVERTVNIHTDYIQFLDFEMCAKDKEFLMQQGYKHTLLFLQHYMQKQLSTLPEKTNTVEPSIQPLNSLLPAEDSSNHCEDSIFYMDEEEEAHSNWLCALKTDNV